MQLERGQSDNKRRTSLANGINTQTSDQHPNSTGSAGFNMIQTKKRNEGFVVSAPLPQYTSAQH